MMYRLNNSALSTHNSSLAAGGLLQSITFRLADNLPKEKLRELEDELLKKLHLLTDEGLTNAAVVLFGKDPGEFYPNLFVKIGRFGLNMVDMRFQAVCEGNLFQLLHDVMEQLEKKFLIKPVRFEGLRRLEELEYPVPALREMLLKLPVSEKPASESSGDDFGMIQDKTSGKRRVSVGKKWGEKWGEKWGKNEIKILELVSRNNKISIVAIAEETGLSTSGVEKIISRLKEQDVLKRIGPAKGGHWEVKE